MVKIAHDLGYQCHDHEVTIRLKQGALKRPEVERANLHNFHLEVVVRACYGAYSVAHVFKYLASNFVSGRPA